MTAKEKIINTAIIAFQVKGIKNVTMDSISQSAGVSKRTVYELFNDKESLAIEAIKEMVLRNNKEIIDIIGQTDNVIEALFLVLENESKRRESLSPIFHEDIVKYHHEISRQLQKDRQQMCEFSASYAFLLKGMEQGVIRKDLNIDIVDTFMHEMLGMLHTNIRLQQYRSVDFDLFINIILPYIRGICTNTGIKLIDSYTSQTTISKNTK